MQNSFKFCTILAAFPGLKDFDIEPMLKELGAGTNKRGVRAPGKNINSRDEIFKFEEIILGIKKLSVQILCKMTLLLGCQIYLTSISNYVGMMILVTFDNIS